MQCSLGSSCSEKVFEETTLLVTEEYLKRYFHDLYFQLIVCDKEQHKPALRQLEEWNFSYHTPLAFWSVIFFILGLGIILPMITRSHGKKYCRAQSQVWNGTKCLGSGVGTHIFITIPLRKKKNWNERERVYMWDINIIVQCCFSIVCYSIHFTSLPIPNVLPPSIPPNHTPPAFMSPVQVIVLLLSMF